MSVRKQHFPHHKPIHMGCQEWGKQVCYVYMVVSKGGFIVSSVPATSPVPPDFALLLRVRRTAIMANKVISNPPNAVTEADRQAYELLREEGIIDPNKKARHNRRALREIMHAAAEEMRGIPTKTPVAVMLFSLCLELRRSAA